MKNVYLECLKQSVWVQTWDLFPQSPDSHQVIVTPEFRLSGRDNEESTCYRLTFIFQIDKSIIYINICIIYSYFYVWRGISSCVVWANHWEFSSFPWCFGSVGSCCLKENHISLRDRTRGRIDPKLNPKACLLCFTDGEPV